VSLAAESFVTGWLLEGVEPFSHGVELTMKGYPAGRCGFDGIEQRANFRGHGNQRLVSAQGLRGFPETEK